MAYISRLPNGLVSELTLITQKKQPFHRSGSLCEISRCIPNPACFAIEVKKRTQILTIKGAPVPRTCTTFMKDKEQWTHTSERIKEVEECSLSSKPKIAKNALHRNRPAEEFGTHNNRIWITSIRTVYLFGIDPVSLV